MSFAAAALANAGVCSMRSSALTRAYSEALAAEGTLPPVLADVVCAYAVARVGFFVVTEERVRVPQASAGLTSFERATYRWQEGVVAGAPPLPVRVNAPVMVANSEGCVYLVKCQHSFSALGSSDLAEKIEVCAHPALLERPQRRRFLVCRCCSSTRSHGAAWGRSTGSSCTRHT